MSSSDPPRGRRCTYVAAVFFLVAGYLAFKGLDTAYFWDDEAAVGILAGNLLNTGELTAWDGRNFWGLRNGAAAANLLMTLDIPVAAISFSLFGTGTWSGRFPFVLAGLGSLILFFIILRQDWGEDAWLWFYTAGAFSLSVSFLLPIRQCRYYALSLLLGLLTFYFYRKCLSSRRILHFVLLSVSATLSFYANSLIAAAFLLSLGVVHLIFHRSTFSRRDWSKLSLSIFLFSLGSLPFALYFQVWNRLDHVFVDPWHVRKPTLLWWNLRELNVTGFLPWMVVLGLVYFLVVQRTVESRLVRTGWEWLVLAVANAVLVALFSPQPTRFSDFADVRYLIVSLPFSAGAMGVFLWFIRQKSGAIALALFLTAVTTNLLALAPWDYRVRFFLPAYVSEIHNDYPTAYREVVGFLKEATRQDELIASFPDYTNYPLMFYLGDRLQFCCLLNHQTLIGKEKVSSWRAPLFIEESFPDWFIAFGWQRGVDQVLQHFSRLHQRGDEAVRFEYHLVKTLDVFWAQTQRPELNWHNFGPKRDFNPEVEAVYIFRRAQAGEAETADRGR